MDINSFVIGYKKGKASGGGGGGRPEGFHMVRFFNDDQTTLLYTVFVPTGASAMYAGETPTSTVDADMVLVGFEPAATNITADLDCYAVYETAITTLDAASWAQISRLSAEGTAENYFAVGDTKMIHIEGTVGTLEVNGDFGVYIIGFDHNDELEGKGIHFGTFKTAVSNGIDIALGEGGYGSSYTDGTKRFNMNHWCSSSSGNRGGWAGCDMRYDILGSTDKASSTYGKTPVYNTTGYDPSDTCATTPVPDTLMGALPSDLRAVMKPMTKFSNNKGMSGGGAEKITATIEYLPLLAEFELFGSVARANTAEKDSQKQYDYYASGSSKVKYSHSNMSTAIWYSLRSTSRADDTTFVMSNPNGTVATGGGSYSYGIAPIFKV